MGVRDSKLYVEARLSLVGGSKTTAIRMSYPRSGGCCGRGRRTLASFTFRRGTKNGAVPLPSDQAASLNMTRLAALDQDTPVRVQCLAGKATVFCQDLPLSDLLAGLKYTTAGHHAVLYFCLSGGSGAGEGQKRGCPALFCNGKIVGSRAEVLQEARGTHVPETGQEVAPAPDVGQVVVANLEQEDNPAPEAGHVVVASLGQEANPATEAGHVVVASQGQEVNPAPEAVQMLVASPGKETCPVSEAGHVVVASPGQDGLGLLVSVPSLEEGQEETGGATTPAEDEEAGIVHRRAGKGVMDPSPPPQSHPPQPGKTRLGRRRVGGRLSYGPWAWDSLLFIAETLVCALMAYTTLLVYFPD